MNTSPIKLSFNKAKGLFYKTIGNKGGKPRTFWLGRKEDEAAYMARGLIGTWKWMKASGHAEWTDDTEAQAKQVILHQLRCYQQAVDATAAHLTASLNRGLPVKVPAILKASTITAAPAALGTSTGITLEQAAGRTTAGMKARNVTVKCVARFEQAMKAIYNVMPGSTPLASIDRELLVNVVGHFVARPISKRSCEPMKTDTIRTTLGYLKQLLDEADGDTWDGPKKWQRLFRIRWTGLQTPREQKTAANGKATFTNEELADLYSVANDRQKMLLLLGLNTAMAQKEISTLLADDIDTAAGTIDRIRNKTRATAAVRGNWKLWPETLKLVKLHMAGKNTEGLAFTTEDGNPLVNDATDTDSIALTWARLLKTATRSGKTVRPLPFGTLRKTSSTAVLRISGSDAVQMVHLAHSPKTIARRHYTGEIDYSQLHNALTAYRDELVKASVITTATKAQTQAA